MTSPIEQLQQLRDACQREKHGLAAPPAAANASPPAPMRTRDDVVTEMNELQLHVLRKFRQRKQPQSALAPAIERIREEVRKSDSKFARLIELWRELIPEHLQPHATPSSFRAGTLHVEVNCAATGYEIDRLMRGGMEQTLRSRFHGSLVRVKCSQKKR